MTHELYTILGITPQASAEEVKRAFYALVRKHSPEKDPDGFKQIREAYDVLGEPRARQNYDDLQQHGSEISELMAEAEDAMEREDWLGAKRPLKRALVLGSGLNAARNMLGLCHMHLDEWTEADKVYAGLTEREPEVALYWANWGHALAGMADAQEEAGGGATGPGGQSVKQARVTATQKFMKAIQLEPRNAQHHLSLAQVFLDENRYGDALRWAESAVDADDSTDFQDFDAFFFMCMVHLRAKDLKALDKVAERIQSIVPDDTDVKEYVAARFASMAFELAKVGAFEPAVSFVRAATKFDPDDKELKELSKAIRTGAKLESEYEKVQNDSLIINPLQRFCAYEAYTYSQDMEEKEQREFLEGFFEELSNYPAHQVVSSLERLRVVYPTCFGQRKQQFTDLRDEAQQIANRASSSSSSSGSSGGGGCFVATAAYGTPLAGEVCVLRRYRDEMLVRRKTGRAFIELYYLVGPFLARRIAERPRARAFVRACLGRLVGRLRRVHPELWDASTEGDA